MLIHFQEFSSALRDAASTWRLRSVSEQGICGAVIGTDSISSPVKLGLGMLVLQEVWPSASGIAVG